MGETRTEAPGGEMGMLDADSTFDIHRTLTKSKLFCMSHAPDIVYAKVAKPSVYMPKGCDRVSEWLVLWPSPALQQREKERDRVQQQQGIGIFALGCVAVVGAALYRHYTTKERLR